MASLGALKSVHRERTGFAVAAIVGALGAAAAAYLAMWIVAVAVVAAVAAFGVFALRRRAPAIALHEAGLVVAGRTVPFEDVQSVTSSSCRRRSFGPGVDAHVVETRDGPLAFSRRFTGAAELLAAIHEGTRERLRSEVLRAYDAGETVRFGPFGLSDAGIRDGSGAIVPWRQIDRAVIDMPAYEMGETWSQVRVWKKHSSAPLASYASNRVPNAGVMVDVVALAVDAAADEA